MDGHHLIGEDHFGDVKEISCPNRQADDESGHGRTSPAESAQALSGFSAAKEENHPQRQGKQRRAVELGQQHTAQQDPQNRGLGARRVAAVAQRLHCAGEDEQAAHAVDGRQGEMRNQVRRKNPKRQNK